MKYEIIAYETKVVPLKTAVCKVLISEDRTRNEVGFVLISPKQVRDLIDQLKLYVDSGEIMEEGA